MKPMKTTVSASAVREVPQNAQRQIKGGRLKDMTDINPMWRIKMLTEQFGPCGIGWKYTIDRQWNEPGANGEIAAFCNISLYYRDGEKWSEPIHGTGGSALVARETKGLYTSDECYKMALTDAISVACKALGFGADVYWSADRTKYDSKAPDEPTPEPDEPLLCEQCGRPIDAVIGKSGRRIPPQEFAEKTRARYGKALCIYCATAPQNPDEGD